MTDGAVLTAADPLTPVPPLPAPTLVVSVTPVLSYALAYNRIAVVHRVDISNPGPAVGAAKQAHPHSTRLLLLDPGHGSGVQPDARLGDRIGPTGRQLDQEIPSAHRADRWRPPPGYAGQRIPGR